MIQMSIRLVDPIRSTMNMVRFRDPFSVYKTEFETDVEFNNNDITEETHFKLVILHQQEMK